MLRKLQCFIAVFYDDKGSFEFHGLFLLPIPTLHGPGSYSLPVRMKWPS